MADLICAFRHVECERERGTFLLLADAAVSQPPAPESLGWRWRNPIPLSRVRQSNCCVSPSSPTSICNLPVFWGVATVDLLSGEAHDGRARDTADKAGKERASQGDDEGAAGGRQRFQVVAAAGAHRARNERAAAYGGRKKARPIVAAGDRPPPHRSGRDGPVQICRAGPASDGARRYADPASRRPARRAMVRHGNGPSLDRIGPAADRAHALHARPPTQARSGDRVYKQAMRGDFLRLPEREFPDRRTRDGVDVASAALQI